MIDNTVERDKTIIAERLLSGCCIHCGELTSEKDWPTLCIVCFWDLDLKTVKAYVDEIIPGKRI